MTVKGHMRRLPMKRYHKSLVFHHPYPLELQCKLEFLPLPVIASIGHIGGLRHTHTHTHKVKFAMLSASEARSLECQVKWAPTLDCSPRLSSAFCSPCRFLFSRVFGCWSRTARRPRARSRSSRAGARRRRPASRPSTSRGPRPLRPPPFPPPPNRAPGRRGLQ